MVVMFLHIMYYQSPIIISEVPAVVDQVTPLIKDLEERGTLSAMAWLNYAQMS